MRRLGMVVDFEESSVSFKNKPNEWHKLPTTSKGLMLIPLTKEAVDKYQDKALTMESFSADTK